MNQVIAIAQYFIDGFDKQAEKQQKLEAKRDKIIDKLKKNTNPELQEKVAYYKKSAIYSGYTFLISFALTTVFGGFYKAFHWMFFDRIGLAFASVCFFSLFAVILFFALYAREDADFEKELENQINKKTKSVNQELTKLSDWNTKVDFEQYFTVQIQTLRDHGGFHEEAIRKFAGEWLDAHDDMETVSKAEMKSFCQSVLNRQRKSLLMKQLDQGKAANTAEV